VAYLQENVESGRASISFVPGTFNGADVLTKIPAKGQMEYFHNDIGLTFPEEVKAVTEETHMLFEDLKHLSTKNRFQVIQSVGRILGKLTDLGWRLTQRSQSQSELPSSEMAIPNEIEAVEMIPRD